MVRSACYSIIYTNVGLIVKFWQDLLGFELTDPGFDHTLLREFRRRRLDHHATSRFCDVVRERWQALGVIHARGRQRSDSTHVRRAIRALNR